MDWTALLEHYNKNEYCIIPQVFDEEECDEILSWARFSNHNFWNFAGNPDENRLLSRVRGNVGRIFGKNYNFIQTAVHGSNHTDKRHHQPHVDAPQRFFDYSKNDNVQVWILLKADNISDEDTHLHVWSGYEPDSSKEFDPEALSTLEFHAIKKMRVGDVLLFCSWCPHETGKIDHSYSRIAFKIHYFSDQATLDQPFLRAHGSVARSISLLSHNGLEPYLFYLERSYGRFVRNLLRFPAHFYRILSMMKSARS